MISKGLSAEGRMNVTEENTASALGSGTLPVLATPAMILFIEKTASECLRPFLGEGESSVGTHLNIRHTAPSVTGSEVFCRVEVTDTDRAKISFSVKVWDKAGEVGSGTHERFLIDGGKFMAKAHSRGK